MNRMNWDTCSMSLSSVWPTPRKQEDTRSECSSPTCSSRGACSRRPHCLADDAVSCELVSAPNSLLNREINREFRKFRASAAISTSNQRANSKSCSQIPYATEQGIFAAITGNFFGITGNLIEASSESAELLSDRRISTALDVNSWHFCGFPPLAEE